jgi:predicted nucleic acid-binding protein
MKEIVCDTSSLISLTESCLFPVLAFLRQRFNLQFVITEGVFYEAVLHPLSIPREVYSFSALKIKDAITKGVIEQRTRSNSTKALTEELLDYGNNMFYMKGRPLRLIHEGEVEMLAMACSDDARYVLMDERTTRLMVESPAEIKKHLEEEFGINVMVNKRNLASFQDIVEGINVVRSVELVALAYEHGFFDHFSNKVDIFRAALYKIKYSGCSITTEEIERMVKKICFP